MGEMQRILKAAIAVRGCGTRKEAEEKFEAAQDSLLNCGFCNEHFRADYVQTQEFWVPSNFVYLPNGMLQGDVARFLCLDCYRVNMGLLADELSVIVEGTRSRVWSGTAYEVALEQAIMGFTFTHFVVAWRADAVRRAIRVQVEAYAEDGEDNVEKT